jgi:hypothetical protein
VSLVDACPIRMLPSCSGISAVNRLTGHDPDGISAAHAVEMGESSSSIALLLELPGASRCAYVSNDANYATAHSFTLSTDRAARSSYLAAEGQSGSVPGTVPTGGSVIGSS